MGNIRKDLYKESHIIPLYCVNKVRLVGKYGIVLDSKMVSDFEHVGAGESSDGGQ